MTARITFIFLVHHWSARPLYIIQIDDSGEKRLPKLSLKLPTKLYFSVYSPCKKKVISHDMNTNSKTCVVIMKLFSRVAEFLQQSLQLHRLHSNPSPPPQHFSPPPHHIISAPSPTTSYQPPFPTTSYQSPYITTSYQPQFPPLHTSLIPHYFIPAPLPHHIIPDPPHHIIPATHHHIIPPSPTTSYQTPSLSPLHVRAHPLSLDTSISLLSKPLHKRGETNSPGVTQ